MMEEVDNRVLRIFAAELASPAAPEGWQLQLMRALAQSLFFTCQQAAGAYTRQLPSST
jgi:hypothetical protein